MHTTNDLEKACRQQLVDAGIDGRTCFFAGLVQEPNYIARLLEREGSVAPEDVERVLRAFLAPRYMRYDERRANGLEVDCLPMNILLAQGYKRGLRWRNIPLGKTSWDIAIYQQMLQDIQPRTIMEFGTGLGASALFFLDHCHMFGFDTTVITLDKDEAHVSPQMLGAPGIEFIRGDVAMLDQLLPLARLQALPHPWLIVEDCHEHIPLIVRHMVPTMLPGDYLVIEDIGIRESGSVEIRKALETVAPGSLMVDTSYTDMFGRNLTCSPDSIFRKM